jgi:hypothetical protein
LGSRLFDRFVIVCCDAEGRMMGKSMPSARASERLRSEQITIIAR